MSLFQIDPLEDPRWSEFLERNPRASVYHTTGWIDALRRTYGYGAFVATTTPAGTPLTNGLPVCSVRSWLTGPRLVSVPFADHCQPLTEDMQGTLEILSHLAAEVRREEWDYAQIRPVDPLSAIASPSHGFQPSQTFALHQLDLTSSVENIFSRFHRSCIQRKIRRAERERLRYEHGRSETLLDAFYHLLQMTRKRHGLPPQPLNWFDNLLACLGDQVDIHIASVDGQRIAGILTLCFKKTLVYKYGASDARYHNLGSMPFLFWQVVQFGKQLGLEKFDLGRSDLEDSGLMEFKRHLGAAESTLTYYRSSAVKTARPGSTWRARAAKRVFQLMPNPFLSVAGRILYRHFG